MTWNSDMDAAPKDGTRVDLCCMDPGPTDVCTDMFWNAFGSNEMVSKPGTRGIWQHVSGALTWDVSRGAGPTHWRYPPKETSHD